MSDCPACLLSTGLNVKKQTTSHAMSKYVVLHMKKYCLYSLLQIFCHIYTLTTFTCHSFSICCIIPSILPVAAPGRTDCLALGTEVPSVCALTLWSLDRSECESIALWEAKGDGTLTPTGALFMSHPCWVGSYSASKSQMWFNLCSIHCPDCWPLITSKGTRVLNKRRGFML